MPKSLFENSSRVEPFALKPSFFLKRELYGISIAFAIRSFDHSLFSRLIGFFLAQSCRVRTAHQPLEAPEGIKRADSECDRNPEGV